MPLYDNPISGATDPSPIQIKHHQTLTSYSRKSLSSKWEEAEKWVKTSPLNHLRSTDSPHSTESDKRTERFTDIGKEHYDDLEYVEDGRAATNRETQSRQSSSPTRENTPAAGSTVFSSSGVFDGSLLNNWNLREEEKEEVEWNSLEDGVTGIKNYLPEEESRKCCTRCRRENAKVQAWINLQDAKAEAELKKMELKIERMRANMEDKLMKKMAAVEKKAAKWRGAAAANHAHHIPLVSQKSETMKSAADFSC
ncbi:uncharacterized protein LOC116263042 isoform X2 [Nymphaea colorata]|uniref:uncharacterized protein LOC116263042 isoform X2 n=1 Tax=Nymphaea colorata TaxID=210225 RepID=UPI00214E4C98|nr:uncharacterized protein LOC116263042 isoform X2 [Nymphaea colorata]